MAVDLKALREQVAALERDANRAEGALERCQKQLQEEFGCSTLSDAEDLLKEYERKARQAEKRFEREHTKFMKEWGPALDRRYP